MKRIISALFLVLIILAANVACAFMPYEITQITDNDYDDLYPSINDNGYLTWSGWDGSDYEIYLKNSLATTQLTNNILNDEYPHINNSGHIVWQGTGNEDSEIFYYNGLAATQMTDNDDNDYLPNINNNNEIVWHGCVYFETIPYYNIFHYNGVTANQVTNEETHNIAPDINDNGYIAWDRSENINPKYRIVIFDGLIETELVAPEDDFIYNTYAKINNNEEVAWVAYDGDYELFLYDGLINQLTDNEYWDFRHNINDNGYITWGGGKDDESEIFLYYNGDVLQVTNNDRNDWYPDINNSQFLVWSGFDGNDYEIFLAKPVPEPSSILQLSVGLLGVMLFWKRRTQETQNKGILNIMV